jgi:hypothetical protein
MITPPQFSIETDATKLLAHFEQFPPRLRENLRKTITVLTTELLTRVRAAEPVRTGLLRASTRMYVDSTEEYVRGRVRILATGRTSRLGAAFGALEYGAHRRFDVRAYARRGIAVRAYERTANIQARRFLRGSLAAMSEQALTAINETVDKSIAQTNARP